MHIIHSISEAYACRHAASQAHPPRHITSKDWGLQSSRTIQRSWNKTNHKNDKLIRWKGIPIHMRKLSRGLTRRKLHPRSGNLFCSLANSQSPPQRHLHPSAGPSETWLPRLLHLLSRIPPYPWRGWAPRRRRLLTAISKGKLTMVQYLHWAIGDKNKRFSDTCT